MIQNFWPNAFGFDVDWESNYKSQSLPKQKPPLLSELQDHINELDIKLNMNNVDPATESAGNKKWSLKGF